MRLKIKDIKRIVQEEVENLNEAGPYQVDISSPRRERPHRAEPYQTDFERDASRVNREIDARQGHQPDYEDELKRLVMPTLNALSHFNPKWHRWVCNTPQGEEMSSKTLDLETELKKLAELVGLSEAYVGRVLGLRVLVEMPQGFLGQFRTGAERRVPHRASSPEQSEEPASSDFGKGGKLAWSLPRIRKVVTDMITLYDTFTPKMRRSACLGKQGEQLMWHLHNLNDAIGRYLNN